METDTNFVGWYADVNPNHEVEQMRIVLELLQQGSSCFGPDYHTVTLMSFPYFGSSFSVKLSNELSFLCFTWHLPEMRRMAEDIRRFM